MSAASRKRQRSRAAKIENAHGCRESLCKWYDKTPEERKAIAEKIETEHLYQNSSLFGHRTRKRQIDAEVRRFKRGKESFKELIDAVSFISICAERERVLKIVRNEGDTSIIQRQICSVPASDVTKLPDDDLKVYNED
jgi:hypothetical protein